MNTTMTTIKESNSRMCVYHIESNDVLLGRGAPIINNKGNQRFRKIVNARKEEYMVSCRHDIKNQIAREVIKKIALRDGRFLRKLEDPKEALQLGISVIDEDVWVIADDDVTLQKVKQALREQGSKSKKEKTEVVAVKSQNEVIGSKKFQSNESSGKVLQPPPASARHQIQDLPVVRILDNESTKRFSYDDLLSLQAQHELEKQAMLKELLRRQLEADAYKPYYPTLTSLPPILNMTSSLDRVSVPEYWKQMSSGKTSSQIASLKSPQPNTMVPGIMKPIGISNFNVSDLLRFQNPLTSSSENDHRVALARSLLCSSNEAATVQYESPSTSYLRNSMTLDMLKKRNIYAMLAQEMLVDSSCEVPMKRQRTQFE